MAVASEVLGLELRDARDARMLRLRDPATGEVLLTHEESEWARGKAEQARAQAEQTCEEAERARKEEAAARRAAEGRAMEEAQARRAAEARAAALEARLRALADTSESQGRRG